MPVGNRSNLVFDRVQEEVLHQTLIEVQSRLRRNCREKRFPLRPRNDVVLSYRPIQHVGVCRIAPQLASGSGEGQNLSKALERGVTLASHLRWGLLPVTEHRALAQWKDPMDKMQKYQLKKEWQRRQRAAARVALPLPNDQMKALFDYLNAELPRQGCDDTRRMTEQWLKDHALEVDKVLVWLGDNGGFCDCEVLTNCEQAWEEAIRES